MEIRPLTKEEPTMFRTKDDHRRSGHSNLAARMGRWSAAHWKTATFGWLAFVLVAFGLGGAIGMKSIDDNAPGPGESGRMDRILDAGFQQPAGENVLVQSTTLRTSDPAFRAAISSLNISAYLAR
jgi:RND superfamily putative drug exporter